MPARRLSWFVLLLVMFAWARGARGQPVRPITGVVVDAAGGAGIVGATIQIKDTPGAAATTIADGAFELAKAPVTDVVLQVAAPDYLPVEVKVKANKTPTTVAIYLTKKPLVAAPARTLTGVVRDATTNAPIANATVKVQNSALTATTDSDGLFVLDNAPTGDVVLDASAPDHQPVTMTVTATAQIAKVTLAGVAAGAPPPGVTPTTRAIHGRIADVGGEPVPGATVTVLGTTNSALTDDKGEFTLQNVALVEVKLKIEAAGYKDLILTALANVNDVRANVELAGNEQVFIEGRAPVIVKQNLANGASVINSEDLNRVSAPTLDTAMQGKISGANLQYNSGAPGGGAQLRLRGISTINGQSSPLYVIDGVIISNVAIPSGANAITAAAAGGSSSNQDNPVNRISDLNPNDIDNVEVLKGAAAAALYGSKAANGVVIITTKHGRAGKSTVVATQRVGFSTVSNTLGSRKFHSEQEVMDTYPGNPDALAAFNQGKTFDHEAELTQVKPARETIVSATGGTEHGGYFGSILLRDEPGVLTNTGYSKESGRLGATWEFAKRVKLAATANVIHSSSDRGLTNNDNTGTSTYVVLSSTPSFFDLRRGSDGLYPFNPFVGSGANPIQTQALLVDNEDVWRLIGATNLSVKAFEEKHQALTLLAGFGFDRFHQQNTLFSPPELNYESADGLLGTSIDASTRNLNVNVGSSAVYTYEPGDQKWKSATSFGLTYEYVDLASVYVVAQNLTAGQQNVGSGTSIAVQQQRLRTKDQGLYLQEEIQALDKRLSVLGGILAERSSLNGDPDQYYLFPKLAGTYEIPQKTFETLRVRGALGEAGNRPNYGQKFTPLNATTNIGGNAGIVITGLTGAVAGDPNIKPERQLEIEAGVDAVFHNERAVLELTVYQRTINDLLLQRTLAPSTGFTAQFFNGGSMRNRGVEAAAQVVPIVNPFEWTSRAIFTLNRSNITELPVPTFDISTVGFGAGLGAFRIEKGKSATQIVGTVDSDGTIKVVGNGEPDFRVGWANTFKYKNYGLTSLVDWQQGSSVINLTRLLYDFGSVSPDFVNPDGTDGKGKARLDAFTKNKDIRPYVEDATFVKLREVSLYWQVPEPFVKQMMLDSMRVSLSGRNLLTFTKYSGLDPEVSNFGNQPIGRNYDVAPYPPSRSFWLSVDAGF